MLQLLKITVASCSRDVLLNKLNSQVDLTWMGQATWQLTATSAYQLSNVWA